MKHPARLRRILFTGTALTAALTLGGCANLNKKPTNVLTQAQTVVNEADRAGTRAYAAYDLNKAHSHLKKAEAEMNQGHYKRARYLAAEAKVEAELAIAKTQTQKTRAAEKQINKSITPMRGARGTTGYAQN